MDIKKEMEETQKRLQEVMNEINKLEQKKQELLQEALRLDGEIRVYNKLNIKNGGEK